MAFPNDLDTDKNVGFTAKEGEVQSISTLNMDNVSDALHQKQSDDLSGDASKVKKFFDYMALHILIPWINAIVQFVNKMNTTTLAALEEAKASANKAKASANEAKASATAAEASANEAAVSVKASEDLLKQKEEILSAAEMAAEQANNAAEGARSVAEEIGAKLLNGDFVGEKGDQGIQGVPGADGHTPKKGVDYYTPQEKQEIIDEIFSHFPDGNEVEY